MSQEVLYRKWRPASFGDVAGQDPITRTLRNAVAAGTPAHAYLFTGPRGTGKTSTGRILAKAVNCLAPVEGEPDGTCQSCRAFGEGRALDLIELDAASNRGIDEVRALRESVGYSPNAATYKVYLVDEVHMLTDAAFNALLKTLEEPPGHVIFVLATTEPHRIPPTITSRCQRFDFRRIALSPTVEQLHMIAAREGIEVADGGMELIARQSGGSLRDAVNLLDQLAAYHGKTLDIEAVQEGLGLVVDDRAAQLARAAVERDLPAGLALLAAVRDDGIEVRAFVREVVQTLRSLLMLRAGAREELELSEGQLAELAPIAESASAADIVAALSALGEIDFAGDNYDALPAEIAFAAHAVGLPPERDALAHPAPAPAAAAPAPAAARGAQPERQPRARQARRQPQPPQPRCRAPPTAPPTARRDRRSRRRRPQPRAASGGTGTRSPRATRRPPAARRGAGVAGAGGAARAARRDPRRRAFSGTTWRARCSVPCASSRASRAIDRRDRLPVAVTRREGARGRRGAAGAARGRRERRPAVPVEVVPMVWEALQRTSPPPQQRPERRVATSRSAASVG